MKYRCYYIETNGREVEEGIFEVTKTTDKFLTLSMVERGPKCQFPYMIHRMIPRENGDGKATQFVHGVCYWGDSIQVYHGGSSTPFIYEPIKQ